MIVVRSWSRVKSKAYSITRANKIWLASVQVKQHTARAARIDSWTKCADIPRLPTICVAAASTDGFLERRQRVRELVLI